MSMLTRVWFLVVSVLVRGLIYVVRFWVVYKLVLVAPVFHFLTDRFCFKIKN